MSCAVVSDESLIVILMWVSKCTKFSTAVLHTAVCSRSTTAVLLVVVHSLYQSGMFRKGRASTPKCNTILQGIKVHCIRIVSDIHVLYHCAVLVLTTVLGRSRRADVKNGVKNYQRPNTCRENVIRKYHTPYAIPKFLPYRWSHRWSYLLSFGNLHYLGTGGVACALWSYLLSFRNLPKWTPPVEYMNRSIINTHIESTKLEWLNNDEVNDS
jgi:hypothetical protein